MPNPLIDKLKTLQWHQLKQLYFQVFGSEAGTLVLEDLKARCFYYTSTYPTVDTTRDAVLINEGMRVVLLHIINCIEPQSTPAAEESINT